MWIPDKWAERVMYCSEIMIDADGLSFRRCENDCSARQALNKAAKDILSKMLFQCRWDEETKQEVKKVLETKRISVFEKEEKTEKISSPYNKDFVEIKQNKNTPENKPSDEMDIPILPEVSFDGNEHVLYICKGETGCKRKNHKIVPATGIIVDLHRRIRKINVEYCESCKMYFLGYEEYQYYRELYGILLGNISIKNSSGGGTFNDLDDKSILTIYGYSANKKDDLSSTERHLILANMMDRDIVGKGWIINHLWRLIDTRQYNEYMELAVEKWEEDLEWVRNYKIDKQRHFAIEEIKNIAERKGRTLN